MGSSGLSCEDGRIAATVSYGVPLLHPRPTADPSEGRFAACVACGYDLRGLPPDGLCPECAYSIARSLEGTHLLRAADPAWLGLVFRGLKWLSLASAAGEVVVIVYLLFLVVTMVLSIMSAVGRAIPAWISTAAAWPVLIVMGSGLVVMAIAHTGGCIFLSSATVPRFSPSQWARRGVRTAGVLLFAMGAYGVVLGRNAYRLPPGILLMHRAVFQAAAIWYLLSLHTTVQGLERRTTRWTVEVRIKHLRARRSLWALAILMIAGTWGPMLASRFTIPDESWGFTLTLLALAVMRPMLGRVRDNVAAEFAIAQARELAPVSPVPVAEPDHR
jgi:hypothetical protein